METRYTSEKNVQMLLYLMKQHGVRKVIASPGTTNISLVASMQQDSFFELYSAADERSAAYLACGLAAETGEAVALSCTGATASRNYMPGLTEAFYRKLPVLAITSTQHAGRVGNLIPQVIDRSAQPNDLVKLSVQIPMIQNAEDAWAANVAINKALLELRHRGCGPVHINLATNYEKDFSTRELPPCRVIKRYEYEDELPAIKPGRIGIIVGAHNRMSERLNTAIDDFCAAYNGVVFCEHISNYNGKYRVNPALVSHQEQSRPSCLHLDLAIHIGEISEYAINLMPREVWRVSPDGELRDKFRVLTKVFEMREEFFFRTYADKADKTGSNSYFKEWNRQFRRIQGLVPELPFSNAWIARQTISRLPENCVLHLGILNSLRCWDLFEPEKPLDCFSNTGGFGIDGGVSSLIGASLADKDKLFFGVVGDLAFFYDMNVLGNRHLGSNVRLLLVNNGRGTEFRNYNHPAAQFGADADSYIAAAGHYGGQSPLLVKHYAEDLGCEYLSASSKEEYLVQLDRFVSPEPLDKPVVFEVFTNWQDESEALRMLYNAEQTVSGSAIRKAKVVAKKVLGERSYNRIVKMILKD